MEVCSQIEHCLRSAAEDGGGEVGGAGRERLPFLPRRV